MHQRRVGAPLRGRGRAGPPCPAVATGSGALSGGLRGPPLVIQRRQRQQQQREQEQEQLAEEQPWGEDAPAEPGPSSQAAASAAAAAAREQQRGHRARAGAMPHGPPGTRRRLLGRARIAAEAAAAAAAEAGAAEVGPAPGAAAGGAPGGGGAAQARAARELTSRLCAARTPRQLHALLRQAVDAAAAGAGPRPNLIHASAALSRLGRLLPRGAAATARRGTDPDLAPLLRLLDGIVVAELAAWGGGRLGGAAAAASAAAPGGGRRGTADAARGAVTTTLQQPGSEQAAAAGPPLQPQQLATIIWVSGGESGDGQACRGLRQTCWVGGGWAVHPC
jgi:hypothetical protein